MKQCDGRRGSHCRRRKRADADLFRLRIGGASLCAECGNAGGEERAAACGEDEIQYEQEQGCGGQMV